MQVVSQSVESLLRYDTQFFIPPFQRAYAWGCLELERFFEDVLRLVRSKLDPNQADKLEHFLGTIVLREEKGGFKSRYLVVDGQQRLTRSLIFG